MAPPIYGALAVVVLEILEVVPERLPIPTELSPTPELVTVALGGY
jgi:hypothetical protein